MSTKKLLKSHKLILLEYFSGTFLEVTAKSNQPLLPCFTACGPSLADTYLTRTSTLYQSNEFVCRHISLSSLLQFCLCLPS